MNKLTTFTLVALLLEPLSTLSAGQLVKFNPSAWHHLCLELNGDQIIGFVDGEKLATVTDKSCAKGMAFLASTYDRNLFDNVRVGPLPTEGRTK